jgi:hypothetical protein
MQQSLKQLPVLRIAHLVRICHIMSIASPAAAATDGSNPDTTMNGPLTSDVSYPRTWHVEGSGLPGKRRVGFAELAPSTLAVETKLDGAHSSICFDAAGALELRGRSELLDGSMPGRFDLLRQWAAAHQAQLRELLGSRYVMLGEWMGAKHTIYYDALPHLFLEFDVYDRERQVFLDTPTRHALLEGSCVISVPVAHLGTVDSLDSLVELARPDQRALYKTASWREHLEAAAQRAGVQDVWSQTDSSGADEGLYIKSEAGGIVTGRYKWIRPGFIETIIDSASHWRERRTIPNAVADESLLWDPRAREQLKFSSR